MRLLEHIENVAVALVVSTITAIGGGIAWLIRRVLTNQKQIALLEADLLKREQQRAEDRERMANVERGVERIEGILMHRAQGGHSEP